MNHRFRNLVVITLALTLLGALPAAERWPQEAGSPTVEIVLDHHAFARAAARAGIDLATLLTQAREAGATSVAVRETTLLRLRDQQAVTLIDGSEAAALLTALQPLFDDAAGPHPVETLHPGWTYVATADAGLAAWLAEAWNAYFEAGYLDRPPRLVVTPAGAVLAVPERTPRARVLPLGFNPRDLAVVTGAGLDVVPVLQEPPLRTAQMLDLALDRWRRLGAARWVLIEQDPAPGYPGTDYGARYDEVGAVLAGLGAEVGLLEDWDMLGYQVARGLQELTAAAGARGIRVHTVQPELRPVLDPARQLEQHLAAVQERKVRVLYLFPAEHPGVEPDAPARVAGATLQFIRETRAALEAAGHPVGPAAPFTHGVPAPWTAFALAIPTALAGSLVTARTLAHLGVPRGRGAAALAALLPWAALGAAAAGGQVLLRQAAALLAATAFPLLAVDLLWHRLEEAPAPAGRGAAARTAGNVAAAAAAALGGGLLVAGLLTTPEFLQVWAYFRGVKVSFALPMAVLALWWTAPRLRALRDDAGSFPALLRGLPHLRVSLPQVLGAAALLAAAVIIVWRTASIRDGLALELAVRDLLRDLLVVRPRFKEVLLGWPGVVILSVLRPPRRSWLFAAASGAVLVGVGSVINSFAHVFTPLAVSLWRSANGMLLGLPLGGLAALVLRRLDRPSQPARMC